MLDLLERAWLAVARAERGGAIQAVAGVRIVQVEVEVVGREKIARRARRRHLHLAAGGGRGGRRAVAAILLRWAAAVQEAAVGAEARAALEVAALGRLRAAVSKPSAAGRRAHHRLHPWLVHRGRQRAKEHEAERELLHPTGVDKKKRVRSSRKKPVKRVLLDIAALREDDADKTQLLAVMELHDLRLSDVRRLQDFLKASPLAEADLVRQDVDVAAHLCSLRESDITAGAMAVV